MRRSLRFLAALAPFLLAAPADAGSPAAKPNVDAGLTAAAAPAAPIHGAPPPAFVSSRDLQRGVPTFLWAIRGATAAPSPSAVAPVSPEAAALAQLGLHASRYGLTPAALSTAVVRRVLDTGRGGIVVVVGQDVGGVEVFHGDTKVLLDWSLDLVAIGGSLHAGAVPSPKTAGFVRSPADAVRSAIRDVRGISLGTADLVDLQLRRGSYTTFALAQSPAVAAAGLRLVEPARARPVYFPLPDRIVAAHHVEVQVSGPAGGQADTYAYVFAADDGRLLYREDLTHDDTFTFRVWADATGDKRPADGPLADFTPHPTGKPDGSYPAPVASQLVSIAPFNKTADAWLPSSATATQGNNVDAYTDDNAPEGFSAGDTRALATSAGTFDHTYDLSLGPQASLEQRQAAVTQMFYVTNWLHDWWYDSGFDEKGGNAQKDNLGRGGLANDPLLAEGQSGAPTSRNNSNMACPGDGMSPRMHMFVWDGVSSSSLTVQPGNVTPGIGVAAFGPATFDATGTVVLADDGTAPDANDGCEALVNGAAVSGHVALLNRGNCSFKTKVLNAQSAGAVGVIVVDNKPSEPAPPLGDDASITTAITIPSVSVSQADGAAIKAALSGATTATLHRASGVDRDGTIDNTVIAHEWGHYLHLRHVACANQQCLAHSEGWADFNALMTSLRPTDDLTGTYAVGQYAVAAFPDDPAYYGIRRYPYSTDLGHNPLTFKYISDSVTLPSTPPYAKGNAQAPNFEVHAAGEIWTAMLFEGYVAMLQASKAASPPYTFDQARRRMSDYVVGGMTMAPANPTYTEQRDAILATAAAADPADLTLLAQGFAKRGAGTCAVSPVRDSMDFSGVVESFTAGSGLSVTAVAVDDSVSSCDGKDGYLDAGETGLITVHVTNSGATPLTGATATLSTTTPGVTFPKGATVMLGDVDRFASATGTAQIALAASVTGKQQLSLHVALDPAVSCATTPFTVSPYLNTVEVPASTATDDVEAKGTTWTTGGANASMIWSRVEATPGNHVWAGVDFGSPSDTYLVSPPLTVSASTPFALGFTHAHSFENSSGAHYDGSVIEISTDAGKTWVDISMYGNPGYGGTIGDPMNMAMNVLKDRQGYVGQNPSWPATDKVSIDMGMKLAGQTVKVRFRIGTDDAQGDSGWRLDDIGFQGLTGTPFTALVADTAPCSSSSSSSGTGGATGSSSGAGAGASSSGTGGGGGGHVYASGGCGCRTSGDGADGKALAVAILALAAVGRRRRRARVAPVA